MSNTDPEGRRYSRRLANESASQSFDPFEGNDLSTLLSTQQSTQHEDSATETINNQTDTQQSNISLFGSGEDDLLSMASESQYHYNDYSNDHLTPGTSNSAPASQVNSTLNSQSDTSSRATKHSERLASLEKAMDTITEKLNAMSQTTSPDIQQVVTQAIAAAMSNVNPSQATPSPSQTTSNAQTVGQQQPSTTTPSTRQSTLPTVIKMKERKRKIKTQQRQLETMKWFKHGN